MMKGSTERNSRIVTRRGGARVEKASNARAESQKSNRSRSSSARSTKGKPANEKTSGTGRKRKCDVSNDRSPIKKRNIALEKEAASLQIHRKVTCGRTVDSFCWICHKKADEFHCEECPRVYHNKCLKKAKTTSKEPICQCKLKTVEGLESLPCNKTDLNALLVNALDHIIGITKNKKDSNVADLCVSMFKNWPDVPENEHLCYIIDIATIATKLADCTYENTGQFFQEVKWIYHNCCIIKGAENEMALIALKFEKTVRQQVVDAEACFTCYLAKSVKYPAIDFFTDVCENPHPIVWAKLKGFPYWPAKCLRIINGHADVRFFGTHDKAIVQLSQVYKISRHNPGGNPKKPKNSIRRTSYEEALIELSIYISNYQSRYGSFKYYSEKTRFDGIPPRNSHQIKSANQLNNSINSEMNGHNIDQERPQLTVSVLNDDHIESKVSILQSASEPMEKFSKKSSEDVAYCQMSIAVDDDNTITDMAAVNEITDGVPVSQSQLLSLTVNSIEGTQELCVSVPSEEVMVKNIDTTQNNYIYSNPCEESSLSSAPCVITSTRSLNSIFPMGEISETSVNSHESSSDINMSEFQNVSEETMPQCPIDDDEIQVVQERHRKSLVEGVCKNKPLTKTFCQLLLGNKPSIRNHISAFQNMALRFYLMMWLEVNSGKLDMNECKMFHTIYERLYRNIEAFKSKVSELEKENAELKEKLSNHVSGEDRKKEILNVVVEAQRNNNIAKIRMMKKEVQKLSEDLKESKTSVNIFREMSVEEKAKNKELESLLKQKDSEISDYKKEIEDLKNKLSLKNDVRTIECQTDFVSCNSREVTETSSQRSTSIETEEKTVYEQMILPTVYPDFPDQLPTGSMYESLMNNMILINNSANFMPPPTVGPPVMAPSVMAPPVPQASGSCYMKNESSVSQLSKVKTTNYSYKQNTDGTHSKSSSEVIAVARKNYSKSSIKKRK